MLFPLCGRHLSKNRDFCGRFPWKIENPRPPRSDFSGASRVFRAALGGRKPPRQGASGSPASRWHCPPALLRISPQKCQILQVLTKNRKSAERFLRRCSALLDSVWRDRYLQAPHRPGKPKATGVTGRFSQNYGSKKASFADSGQKWAWELRWCAPDPSRRSRHPALARRRRTQRRQCGNRLRPFHVW